jgi:hypothetical protein
VVRSDGNPGPIYKLEWRDSKTAKPIALGYYQPESLRAPNGRLVVFGGEVELKIVDLVHRRAYVPRMGNGCFATPVLWKRQHRLILTLWCGDAHRSARSDLLVLDPERHRFVGRREIGLGSWASGRKLVVFVSSPPLGGRAVPGTTIREELEGPARLLRVGADGRADEIRLPIRAGSARDRTLNRFPALVLDTKARYAYVIGEGQGCARIDLRTLRVEWHRLPHAFDAQPRLASKPHQHEGTANPSRDLDRRAVWLGNGKIAVTGEDTWSPHSFDRTAPAGLKILDTNTWRVRMIDPYVSIAEIVRRRLVATGPHAGLTVYDLGGRRLLRRFAGKQVWIGKTLGDRIEIFVQTVHVESNPKLDRSRKTIVDLP